MNVRQLDTYSMFRMVRIFGYGKEAVPNLETHLHGWNIFNSKNFIEDFVSAIQPPHILD